MNHSFDKNILKLLHQNGTADIDMKTESRKQVASGLTL
jgi:hypothetical protein